MDLENIYDKKNNIFQSDIWAEFQKEVGREAVEINGVYFYKEHLIREKYYLYSPKGAIKRFPISPLRPPTLPNRGEIWAGNLQYPMENIVFLRVEPDQETINSKQLTNLKKVTRNSILSQQYSPEQTIVLDLSKSEEEILANMKPKHRYNLRLAEKRGVKIKQAIRQIHGKFLVNKKDVDDFYKLSLEVSDRDSSYSPHPKSYYEKMVETIGEKGNLQIFTSEYEGNPLSSIIILFYNDTAIYLHGASSSEHRELMPNHLAQWEAIKEAKKRGCKYYDFWGTSLRKEKIKSKNEKSGEGQDFRCGENDKNKKKDKWVVDEGHAWKGVTKFKLGFVKFGVTGEVVEFPGAYDLPLDKLWYNGLGWSNRVRKVFKK